MTTQNLEEYLEKVKVLLPHIGEDDTSLDAMLIQIIEQTEQRLLLRLSGGFDAVPEALAFIVVEVSIIRYNRLANEGMSSATVEGESLTFAANDFAPYEDDIQAWLDAQDESPAEITRGRVRFL